MRMLLAIIVSVWGLRPAIAQTAGENKPSIIIVPLPVKDLPPQTVDQVLATLAGELRRIYHASVLGGRAVGRAVWGSLDDYSEKQARAATKLVEEAFQAYKMLELDKANHLLDQAEAALEFGGVELDSPETLRKAHFFRGLVALGLGHQAEATEAFARAAAFDPAFSPPRDKFAPRIIKVFQDARKKLQAAEASRLQVVSNPGGAEVFLDGRSRGTTPLILEVPPGRHYLRLQLADHAPWTLNLPDGPCPPQVKARMVPQWTADPPADLLQKAISTDNLDEAEVAVLRLLAGFFRAEAIVLAAVTAQANNIYLGVRLFVVRPEAVGASRLFNLGAEAERFPAKIRGVATTLEPLRALRPTRVAETAAPSLPPNIAPPPPRPVEPLPSYPTEPDSGGTRWYKSWWFWTVVGVAVAGAAAGTAIWLTRPEASWTLVVRPTQP